MFPFGMASIPIWPAFMTFTGLTPPGVSIVPASVAVGDIILCVAGCAIAVALMARDRALDAPLLYPMSAYAGSWILASLLGLDPFTGLLMSLALVLGTVFASAICAWYTMPCAASAMYAALLGGGTFVSLLGIVMVVLRRPTLLYTMVLGRATTTFIVPGEFAGYLLLLIAAAGGIAAVTKSLGLRTLAAATIVSGGVALVLTYSRAGWLGAAAGVSFFAFMQLREKLRWRTGPILAAAAGAIALVAVVFVALSNGHHNPSEEFERLPIWISALRTIELFPLTGVGPGAYHDAYPFLRPLASPPGSFHAHDLLLTAFAETGIIGCTALLALWWLFVAALRTELRRAAPAHRTLALALAAGLIATWTQGLVDFIQIVVLGCWLPFMALAIAAARSGLPER